jgi:hypothetical protein
VPAPFWVLAIAENTLHFERIVSNRAVRFDDDERHLLATFARSLNFTKAATELGISPKALRSKLVRLKTRRQVEA